MARAKGVDGTEPAGSAPMVDRHLEMTLLRGHLTRVAHSGSGHGVLLVGESGVGKTRIAEELLAEAGRLEMEAIVAQCVGRGAEPLLPLKEALARHLGRTPDRIRRSLLAAAPRLLDAIPFVGAFLGKLGEMFVSDRQLGGGGTRGVYEGLARLLLGIADKRGLFLVVEDLHAADQDTLYFLNYFLKKVRSRRVLTLATIQEEQLRELPQLVDLVAQWTTEGYAALTVTPLERAHVGEYVRAMDALGVPVDDQLVDRLFAMTGGNPFILRETLQLFLAASQAGAAGQQGAAGGEPWAVDEGGELPAIPARAEALLRRHLARTTPATQRFLEAAAVALQTAQELPAVVYVLDVAEANAIDALNDACKLRLMRETPDGRISFVHALMQQAVYAQMGYSYRRYLHGRAGEWSQRAGSFVAASHHFERAGRTDDMVRTALEGAAWAERTGMYHSALVLYRKASPHVAIEELGPRLGHALIILGQWQEAADLIERLPVTDARVRLLRSELRFAQGAFREAADEARAALGGQNADQVKVLTRMADIELHLGNFAPARDYTTQALTEAERLGSVNQQARCLGIIGAITFHSGDIAGSEERYNRALALLLRLPDDERDHTIHPIILGNLGFAAEIRGDLAAAEQRHAEALRLRREVADALGVLHSTHSLARTRIAAGDQPAAIGLLNEAEQLSQDLDEPLGGAKVKVTRARLALEDGDHGRAEALASEALETFTSCATAYDVTETHLVLSDITLRAGRERDSVQHGATARAAIARHGYGLLAQMYPRPGFSVADRIAGALTAYACADGLGLPWEGHPPAGASAEQIEAVPQREGWQRGSTTDDTALTMLAARHLIERLGTADATAFLGMVAQRADEIPGMGPSTTAAIERFRETGEPPTDGGTTNGAAMRAMPAGWATPLYAAERRRQLTVEMSRATHPDPDAMTAACGIAACAAWAVEGAGPRLLLTIAIEEQAEASAACGGSGRLGELLAAVADGTWRPAPEGVGLDASDTVAAALDCVVHADSLRAALLRAIGFGGDTDTVAALACGLLGGARTPSEVTAELPWHTIIRLPAADEIAEIAHGLAALRAQ